MDVNDIVDRVAFRSQAAAVPAEPGSISIQDLAGVMNFVDDQGVATPIEAGSSSGSVTSVAATVGGLLVIGGTPTIAPTVGIAAMPANTVIVNATGDSAVPTATKLPLAAMATQADKTVLGNGSGGALAPVALVTSTATGLIMDATTLKNSFRVGVAGGQTLIGGTAASDSLTVSSTANATKGTVIFGSTVGMVWDEANNQLSLGAATAPGLVQLIYKQVNDHTAAMYVANDSAGGAASANVFLGQDPTAPFSNGLLRIGMLGSGYTPAALLKPNSGLIQVQGGNGDLIIANVQAVGDIIFATGTSRTERMRLTAGGQLTMTASIVPATDVTYNLGGSSKGWANLFVENIGLTGVPGIIEFVPSQGVEIDSNTTGNFQITHQSTNGRFISDATGIAFFQNPGGAPVGVAQQTSGANLTNNVTSGGTDNTIADFTSLTVYATDAAAIRNDIYQLARKLKQINDGLRAYGLFT